MEVEPLQGSKTSLVIEDPIEAQTLRTTLYPGKSWASFIVFNMFDFHTVERLAEIGKEANYPVTIEVTRRQLRKMHQNLFEHAALYSPEDEISNTHSSIAGQLKNALEGSDPTAVS